MPKHIHIWVGSSTRDDQKHVPAGSPAGGQFVSGGGVNKISKPKDKKIKREGLSWLPNDNHNKTGNLARSPHSLRDWREGTGGLQQAVKDLVPAWVKGQPMTERKEALKNWASKIPVEEHKATDLLATQWNIQNEDTRVYKAPLFSTIGGEHPIAVRTPDGSLHVVDGHHRVDKAASEGKSLKLKVINIKGPTKPSWLDHAKDSSFIFIHNH